MSGYKVASLTGVESLKGPGTLRWTPLRKHFGITAFGVNAYTHPALHYHLACINARAGRLDEARKQLDRALELDPDLQKWADEDEDLKPLRVAGEP